MGALEELGLKGHLDYPLAQAALELAAREPMLLTQSLTLYDRVGRQADISARNTGKRIHTLSKRAWLNNRALLEKVAGYPLPKPPKAGEFLAMIYVYDHML